MLGSNPLLTKSQTSVLKTFRLHDAFGSNPILCLINNACVFWSCIAIATRVSGANFHDEMRNGETYK